MADRFELQLRRGLVDLIEPEAGAYPRWATSPAAARVAELGGAEVRGAWRFRGPVGLGELRGRLGLDRPRLILVMAALLLLLLVTLAVSVGSRRSDRSEVVVPTFPSVAVPAVSRPQSLVASGIDVLAPELGDYSQAVLDTDGRTIWLLDNGRVTRYDPTTGATHSWTIGDDLAFSTRTITSSAAGGVWLLGSWSGANTLRWFDGEAFRAVIEPPGVTIAVAEARDGSLWIVTEGGGVHRWRAGSWTQVGAPAGAEPDRAALAVDSQGSVWVASRGVDRFDGASWRSYDANDAAPLGGVAWSIEARPDGTVWVATDRGLARFDGARWTSVLPAPGGLARVTSSAVTADGTIWAAAADTGDGQVSVARFDGRWTTFGAADGLGESGWIRAWVAVVDDTPYVATSGGLFGFDGKRWSRVWPSSVAPNPSWGSDWFGDLVPVSSDEAWASTEAGIWHFRDGTWSLGWPSPTTAEPATPALALIPNDTLWAATPAGVLRLEDGRWGVIDRQPAETVVAASDRSVWAGSATGLRHIDALGSALPGAPAPPADAGGVRAAAPDGSLFAGANIWGMGALARYDGTSWQILQPVAGKDVAVNDIEIGVDGDVWVALDGLDGGEPSVSVARLHGGTWTLYGPADGLAGSQPAGLAIGPDGSIWVPTTAGLRRFDGDRWLAVHDGLFFESVWVATDSSVWATGPGGLVRFSPDPLPRP